MTMKSCIVGSILLSLIYTGLALIAHHHSQALINYSTPELVNGICAVVLGKYGSIFVCLCVFLACITTASALAEVSTLYFYESIFQLKIPKVACLLIILVTMYGMSILQFDGIMSLVVPILKYLYPGLVIYSIVMILSYHFKIRVPTRRNYLYQSDLKM